MNILFRASLTLMMIVVVSACGFQLRGNDGFHLTDQKILLISETPFSEFDQRLSRDIKAAKAVVVNDEQQADFILTIVGLEIIEQGVSRDATGRANEVVLRAELEYRLNSSPSVAVNELSEQLRTLKASRSYYQDFRSPVSDRNLRKDTRENLYVELSRRLLVQISRSNSSSSN